MDIARMIGCEGFIDTFGNRVLGRGEDIAITEMWAV